MTSATDPRSDEVRTSSFRSRSWKARWFQRPVSCEPELLVGELLQSDAVDVERALDATARDERNRDERLGVRRGAFDEPYARVEVGAVREHRLAVVDGPAGNALPERERRIGQHLVRILPAGENAPQFTRGLVGLVER
jgi:hypothetical protein